MVITNTHYGDMNYKIVVVHLAGRCPGGKINHVQSVLASTHVIIKLKCKLKLTQFTKQYCSMPSGDVLLKLSTD